MRKKAMKNIVTVTSKEKQELSTHKVELGIVDEISKQLTESEQLLKKIQSEKKEFSELNKIYKTAESSMSRLLQKYSDNRDKFSSLFKEISKNYDLLDKAAKEIGVDVTTLPSYKDYNQIMSNWDKASDENQSNWDIVSKYSTGIRR